MPFKGARTGVPESGEAVSRPLQKNEDAVTTASATQSNNQTIKQSNNGIPVLAPLNGTFYRSDAPGKPKMADDGAAVKAGQPVCVVEAMKLFNPIKASAAGKITFLVEHGKAVTKGQVLATIA